MDHCRVLHPTRGLEPFRPYRYQGEYLEDAHPAILIVKARQVGFSQAAAVKALHRMLYHPGRTQLVVSKNLEAALEIRRYLGHSLPLEGERFAQPAGLAVVKANESEVLLSNGSRFKAVAAGPNAGRSIAASDVYIDEIDFQPFARDTYQSISPTISRGGTITIFSTPKGRGRLLFQLWSGTYGGATVWQRYNVPWTSCPEFDEAWYQRERPKYTEAQWAEEYGCDFIESGEAVFRADDLVAQADGWTGLREPEAGRRYVTAWDIGRRHDATVGITLDVTDEIVQVVAFERLLGVSFPVIQAAIERRARAYRGKHAVESNGVGDPVIENVGVRIDPFLSTAKTKQQAITALQLVVEQRRLKHNVEQLRIEQSIYQWDDSDLVQDCVMAAAIACHVAGLQKPPALNVAPVSFAKASVWGSFGRSAWR